MDYVKIIVTILMIAGGFLATYFKTRTDLIGKISTFILEAEEEFKDWTKAGNVKFESVVDKLYSFVPVFLKPILTKAIIGTLVQSTFETIEAYAKKQLDKLK